LKAERYKKRSLTTFLLKNNTLTTTLKKIIIKRKKKYISYCIVFKREKKAEFESSLVPKSGKGFVDFSSSCFDFYFI